MKKIVIIIPNLGGGGAERVITTIIHYLNRNLWSLTLIVVQDSNSVYGNSIPRDVEYIELHSSRVRFAIPKIISILWKIKPDIVFSTLSHLNLALALVRSILPNRTSFVARETSIVTYMNKHNKYPRLTTWLYRAFYSNLDFIICQSNHMAVDLIDNFNVSKGKIRIIFNPVDINRVYELANSSIVYSDNMIKWSNIENIKLLSVGRMSPEKGFDILIRAIHLCRDLPIKLLIVGSGPCFEELSKLVHNLGISEIVALEKFTENPYPLMALADGFILSSHFEGFPNAVLEAATLGTPIIATPAPGGLFDIIENIKGCHLAAGINSEDLARELRTWCGTARKRLERNCTSKFNAIEIVSQYEEVFFESLINV